MKKLSLLIVFVMLLVAVLAFSASAAFTRGEEGQTITMEDVESIELISGSTGTGDPSYVMDGTGNYWGGPAGSAVQITFVNEWEIASMSAYLIQNWTGCKISIHAADGTELASFSEGNQTYNTGYIWGGDITSGGTLTDMTNNVKNVSYGDNDPAVKYVVLKCTQDKWGYLTGFGEIYFTGRERIPSEGCENHSFISVNDPEPTCTEDGITLRICELCGAQEAPATAPALGHVYDSYTVLPPENCLVAPKIQFECTRCGEIATKDNHIQDVTDFADFSSGVTVDGSGGWTDGTMFDNDWNKKQQASSGWFVSAELELDQPYYLQSVTIWTGYMSGYSGDWIMTFYYMAPDGTEWISAGTKAVPPTIYEPYAQTEHTMVLETPVYAKAVKIRVDSITHGSGFVFEAEIAGTYIPDAVVSGHTWVAGEVVAPTCVQRGYTNYTCSVCNETTIDSFVNFTGEHVYNVVVEGSMVEATCAAAGKVTMQCATCTSTKDVEIPALEHDLSEATCTEAAKCKNCDYTEGEALGHTEVELPAVEVTCTENGLTAGSQCSVCNEVIVAQEVIEAEGHDMADATCLAPSMCIVCGYTEGEPLAHTIVHVEAKAGTDCQTFDGNVEYWYCSECGSAWTDEARTQVTNLKSVAINGAHSYFYPCDIVCQVCFEESNPDAKHNIVHVEAVDATCTENGNIEYWYCSDCGTAWADEALTQQTNVRNVVVPAAGHQYFYPCDVVCMVCYEETNPDATHNIVYVEAVEATCQATGNVEYWYCSDCGSAWLDEAQTQITNLRSVITVGDHIAAWDFSDEETGYVGAYEWVNATCMAEGYHKDKCATCGEVMVFETFPVDTEYGHVVVEGTYTQVDANCKDAGSFSYECEVCGETITGEIEVDPYAHVYDDGAIVDGKLVYTCTVCGGTEEKVVVELVVGDNTVNFTYVESMWGGSYEAPYVIITAPGKYTITSTEASFDLYGGRGNFTWIEELPYEFEVAEGEYVIFVLSGTVSWDQTSAVVTLAEAGCNHANTEEIPAVLPAPSNNHTGMTAGVKCLDCEAVIVEPVETVATSTTNWSVFGVQNMSLALSNNIAINYNINVSNGYNDVYMVFVYEGTEYIYTEYTVESSNRIVFKFDKTRPHKMASNVDGYVYSSTANGYVVDTIPGGYSIMKYCQQAIDAYKGKDEVFVKLIYDLIAYGAAVQKYENKNISDAELVTTMMEEAGYELAPTEFVGIGEASSISYVDKEPSKYYWYDVQLMLGSSTVLYYNFQAPDIDGLTIKVEYSDQTIIFENEDIVSLGGNNYRIEIGTLASTQYVYDVKATFITADGQEASSMTWSINGYLKVAVDAFSGETKELMEALYIYGESIRAYFNN